MLWQVDCIWAGRDLYSSDLLGNMCFSFPRLGSACVEVLFFKGEIPAEIPLNSEPLVHWHFRILIPRDLQARRRVTILALTMISTIIINGMPLSLLHHSTFFAACTADGQILCFSVIISCVANPVFSGLVHHTLTLEVSLINFSPF